MRIPATRERVRIDGREGVFIVVWVDQERQTADLIPAGEGNIEDSVPFAKLRPLHGDPLEIKGVAGAL